MYIENKRDTAKRYQGFFEGIIGVEYIPETEFGKSNFWLNAIRFPSKKERDEFLVYSNDNGVMTRPIWKLMNELNMFKDCPSGCLEVAEALENTIVNIPSSVRI